MKTYISTISEPDLYRKILNTADKTVSLILLYDDDNDSISLSVFESFSTAKCKVQFEKVLSSDIGYAYTYGRLMALNPEATLLSNHGVLNALVGLSSGTTKKRRSTGQKQSVRATSESVVKESPKSTSKPVKKTPLPSVTKKSFTSETSATTTLKSPAPTSKPATPKKSGSEDDIFEQEFKKLEQFLDEFTTKDFNPKTYMTSIVNTAKMANREGITFTEAAAVCLSPAVLKKTLAAIPEDKRAALVMLIAGMHDAI